jgi:hypothetical protein
VAQGRERKKLSPDKGTTTPGFVNLHGQEVMRNTGKAGTDHGQYVYELKCQHCGNRYGSNGSDNFQRKCWKCQGGAKGPAL